MVWMLIAFVAGELVETGLTYESLEACLEAEDAIRREHAEAYNKWLVWAQENPEQSGYPDSQGFMKRRIGLSTNYTCIPVAADSGALP
jgi:hypothetical protein